MESKVKNKLTYVAEKRTMQNGCTCFNFTPTVSGNMLPFRKQICFAALSGLNQLTSLHLWTSFSPIRSTSEAEV